MPSGFIGFSESRRSIYSGSDNANEVAAWFVKKLSALPESVRSGASVVCTPLDDGGFMVGIRHANVDSN